MAKNIFVRSKSFRNALQRAGRLAKNRESLSKLLSRTKKKASEVGSEEGSDHNFFDKLFTFVRMIRAYISGEYKKLPVKTLILMVAGLVYFVMPLDVIPDFIPGIGLIDDVSVILAIFKSISGDVDKFEAFERDASD